MCFSVRFETLILALLFFSPTAEATSAEPLNPLDTISTINVEILIGESVGSIGKRLLFEEEEQRSVFVAEVRSDIETALGSADIISDPQATDSLLVGVWGHREVSSQGEVLKVFLVELSIVDVDFASAEVCPDERDLVQESKAIGVVREDESLGAVLRSEIMRLLNEWLPRRPAGESPVLCQHESAFVLTDSILNGTSWSQFSIQKQTRGQHEISSYACTG